MKLEIENVRFKNFLSFGSTWQDVDFLPGVNAVIGIDKDKNRSNGVGKSSFLETIPFALYGQIHRNVNKGDIVNWKNRKACEVRLRFMKGDIEYLIMRSIKPNKLEIYENSTLIPQPAAVKDYQKMLEDILGFNFITFMSLVHSNINSSNPILSMNKPDKRKFLEKIFGLTYYTNLNEKANERLKRLKLSVDKLNFSINSNNDITSTVRARLLDLGNKLNSLKTYDIELNELKDKLRDIEGDLDSNAEDKLEELSNWIKNKEMGLSILDSTNVNVMSKITLLNHKIKTTNEEFTKLLKEIEGLKRNEEIKKIADDLKKEHGDVDVQEANIKILRESLESIVNMLIEKNDIISKLMASKELCIERLEDVNEKIKHIEETSECPLCETEIKNSSILEKLKRDNRDLNHRITNEFNVSIERHSTDMRKLITEKASLERDVVNASDILSNLTQLLSSINLTSMDDIKNLSILKKLKKFRYERAKNKLEKLSQKLANLFESENKVINITKEQDNILRVKVMEAKILRSDIENLTKLNESEKKLKTELLSLIASDNKQIKGLEDKNKKSKETIKKTEGLLDYLILIKEICKDENIKQHAIRSIMPIANKNTNKYLSESGHVFYVLLDKWLDATIKGPGITGGSYGSLSGGEGRSIDIALQLALLDIARIRAGNWPDIIVKDEILDSSIDSEGLPKLMDIIKTKQMEENNKVFIVSHRPEIEEAYIDNVYWVEKENGFSKISLQ
jgi:DNA repair exonuclease SbcCD ATPase subunit